jgi:hypothetical protein
VILVALAIIAWPVAQASGQSPGVSVAGDALYIKAPSFSFIKGDALDRLKQGRPVRFDLSLAVVSRPGGPEVTQARQSFNLSYDLWEERFAVTRVGPPSPGLGAARSISHLTAKDAEAWCLVNLPLAVSAMGGLGRHKPFWIRLHYQIVAPDPAPSPEEGPLSVRALIDMLSRRRKAAEQEDSLEAGPLRLPD